MLCPAFCWLKEVAGVRCARLNMKKLLAFLLVLLTLLACIPFAAAETADYADIYLDIKPMSASDGRLMLEIEVQVQNGGSDQCIRMLEFRYENDLIASVDEIYGGKTAYLWSNPINMSLSGMTRDLEIEVSYVDFHGGSVYTNHTVSAEAAEPQISFKRTVDKNAVALGGEVTLTYIVKNEGSVTLENVEVYDDMPGVGVVGVADVLYPGDMREFTKLAKVEKDVKSQPRCSYSTLANDNISTLLLDSMSIVVSNPKLSVILKSDVAQVNSGESVTLVCSVVNEGNVSFTNAAIYDETLGVIIENAQLEVGKAYSWNKLIKPVASQNYMFTVKAIDESGQIYTATSNITTVEVNALNADEGTETLEVSVTPNTKELSQPGEITFHILLRNTGAMDATGVTIMDRDGNVLEQINALPPGDKMLPVVMNVEQTGDYYFTVTATLSSGTRVQQTTMPISISVGSVQSSAEPLNTTVIDTPEPTPGQNMIINNDRVAGIAPWVIGAIIFIALLIVACVVVLIILQARTSRRREEEEEELYVPPQKPRPVQRMPERDPYDYREEISRAASEYSRPVPQNTVRRPEPKAEDEEEVTVYKPRRPEEPHTRR